MYKEDHMATIRERIKEEKERIESQTIQSKWVEAYSSVNNDILVNLEQTKAEMEEDSKITANLYDESLRQINLHSKWAIKLSNAKKEYRQLKQNKDSVYLKLWKFYQQKMSQSFQTQYIVGFSEKVLKSDVDKYIEADEAWVKIKETVQNQYALVELIESMMEGIKARGFAIKNAIEVRKFENGVY